MGLENKSPTSLSLLWVALISPDAGEGGLDFFLEAGDQFAVGGDQRLLGFDLGDDGLLRGQGWKRNRRCVQISSALSLVIATPEIIESMLCLPPAEFRKKARYRLSSISGLPRITATLESNENSSVKLLMAAKPVFAPVFDVENIASLYGAPAVNGLMIYF